jgi:hypothetical protein
MAIECEIQGHIYVFEVDYGEETETARIIVRCAAGGTEGLFLVQADGSLESGDDLSGFGPNPVAEDGLWPLPPEEAIEDARHIAAQKGLLG